MDKRENVRLHEALDQVMEEDLLRYTKEAQGAAPSSKETEDTDRFTAKAEEAGFPQTGANGLGKGKRGKLRLIRLLSYAAAACVLLAAGFGAGRMGVNPSFGAKNAASQRDMTALAEAEYEYAYEYDGDITPLMGAAPSGSRYAAELPTTAALDAAVPEEVAEATADAGDAMPRKLVSTYSVSAESLSFEEDIASLETQVAALGGYIESSSLRENNNAGNTRYVSYTLRIPAETAEAFLSLVDSRLHITSRSTSTEDITLSYYDTKTRLSSYRNELETLEELMKQAEDIEDILAIESQITELHYRIDSYETSLRGMDNRVDYATLNMSISEVRQVSETGEETVGERIARGFSDSLSAIADGAVSLFVWVASHILYLLIAAAAIALVILAVRRLIRRRKGH